jgi:hypothetical protein
MTKEQAAFEVVAAITEIIRTSGEVPSGELYAYLMDKMSLETYNRILSTIKSSGLVVEKNHLLVWVGPKF